MKVGAYDLGDGHSPFVIAELSGNHNQSLHRALAMVDAAAETGVNAIKLQTYTADTMTLNLDREDFYIFGTESPWHGESLYELYQQAHTPWEWHEPIFRRARERGLLAFSTPFDATAVDFLEQLGAPCYKIASFENVDIPLIERAAATGKPLIISTGMASEEEIWEAVDAARGAGCKEIALLKCSSSYPASPKDANLLTIPQMRKLFNCEVGLSDHTMGIGVAIASIALGATIIEKHFTLCRADGGVDSAFSMEPEEMKQLVTESVRAWEAMGRVHFGPTEAETKNAEFRRSIYVVKDISVGEEFTLHNIRCIRPGKGLAPKNLVHVLGRRAAVSLERGTALTMAMVL